MFFVVAYKTYNVGGRLCFFVRAQPDEDITKGKDHEALEGPMTRGRLKQAQHVIETRLVICIAAIDDD